MKVDAAGGGSSEAEPRHRKYVHMNGQKMGEGLNGSYKGVVEEVEA
jgi:hypothetical protein